MAHVQLSRKRGGGYRILVDGVDLSLSVLARGFSIEIPDSFEDPPLVHMILSTDRLDIDLPDAVLDALTGSREVDVS